MSVKQTQNPMPPEFRVAALDDINDLINIRAQCFGKNWSAAQFQDILIASQYATLLIPQTAYAIIQKIPPEAELITIAVAPSYRRQGIAEHLLKNIQQILQTEKIHTLHLEVNENLTAARALYEKMGFRQTGRRADYYGAGEDAILMRMETPL